MAVTINGVLCNEEVNGNSEQFDIIQGAQATKVYLCDWNQRWQVVTGVLGFNSSISIGGVINIQLPMQYPDFQQTAVSLFASTVSVEGIGVPYQNTYSVGYQAARITVNFRSFPWSFQGTTQNDLNQQIDPNQPLVYAEQNISFTSEAVTVPGRTVKFQSSGKRLADRLWGFRYPIANFNIVLKYVPYIPAAQVIAAAAAPINNATYLGVPAGKLLFNGMETHQARMSNGTYTQDANYSFSYRPIAPWDYDYDGSTATWDLVVGTFTGIAVQKRSDFSGLIPIYYRA